MLIFAGSDLKFFLLTVLYAKNSPYSCIFVFLALNLACDGKNLTDFCKYLSVKVLSRLGNPVDDGVSMLFLFSLHCSLTKSRQVCSIGLKFVLLLCHWPRR